MRGDPLQFVLVLLVLTAAVAIVTRPLRRGGDESGQPEAAKREELEAAREAKYRQIRELELDFQTGKLSREDFEAQDGALRVEAVELLRRLDALQSAPAADDERRAR